MNAVSGKKPFHTIMTKFRLSHTLSDLLHRHPFADLLHIHADDEDSSHTLMMRVDTAWAAGKTIETVERCLGGGMSIHQVIRPATVEVIPHSAPCTLQLGDVLIIHIHSSALQRAVAFIGPVINTAN